MERREAKGKGEKERCIHLKAGYQRITRKEKKSAFPLSLQAHYIGSIEDRHGMDLTEAEDIKKWQEYTEELYKKDLHAPDNHNGVITHLEPDILECEVK